MTYDGPSPPWSQDIGYGYWELEGELWFGSLRWRWVPPNPPTPIIDMQRTINKLRAQKTAFITLAGPHTFLFGDPP